MDEATGTGGTFFATKPELQRHQKEVHGSGAGAGPAMPAPAAPRADGAHECPHCGKRFAKPQSLTRHLQTNHGNFACEKCGKEFEVRKGGSCFKVLLPQE